MNETGDIFGGGVAPPPSGPDETGWYSCADLAMYLNRQKRQVQKWMGEKGCPHRIVKVNNQDSYEGQLGAVRRWAQSQGLDVSQHQRDIAGKRAAAHKNQPERARDDGPSMFDRAVEEAAKKLVGDIPYGEIIVTTRAMLHRLLEKDGGQSLTVTERKNTAETVAKLSTELRQLDNQQHDAMVRRGRYVSRDSVRQFIEELAGTFKADMRSVEATVALRVREELAKLGGIDGVAAARIAAIASRDALDLMLTQRSDWLTQAADRCLQELAMERNL